MMVCDSSREKYKRIELEVIRDLMVKIIRVKDR